jgi:hypothetical protein
MKTHADHFCASVTFASNEMQRVMKLSRFLIALAFAVLTLSPASSAPLPVQQAYIKASNTGASDSFGRAVAVSGDTMVIGAYLEDSDTTGINGDQTNAGALRAGAAYVFVRNGTNWVQQAYLKASNTESTDNFGTSVAISGNTIVIGAPGEDSNALGVNGDQTNNGRVDSGAAYVFVRNGTNWVQQACLKAFQVFQYPNNGHFGESAAVSGDVVIIGAPGADAFSGAAFIFVRNGTNWTPQKYLLDPATPLYSEFGLAVAASGETVAVAGNNNTPRTYVFVRSGTNWIRQGNSTAFKGRSSISLFADTLAIGEVAANATHIYFRNGTNWSEQAELKPSNAAGNFGGAASVSGDTVVVGASTESSNATGVNGDQSNTLASASGAAYVFVRTGATWTQQAYLKASNTGLGDHFGVAAAVSGSTVVIGAEAEGSDATGVNGNPNNNNASFSGAAYVFTGVGVGPQLSIAADGSSGYFIRFNGIADITYELQRAPDVTGSWSSNATLTVLSSGPVEFHDTNAPAGQAFYRAAQR